MLSDLRYAFRQLVGSPGFTFVAVLTLALGIGVNATIFSFVRDMVLRPQARNQEANLAALYTARQGANQDFRPFSYDEFSAIREPSPIFRDVAATYLKVGALGRDDNLMSRLVGVVSGNFFSLLGIRPFQGRFFSEEESQPQASQPVAVASYAFWQRLGYPVDFVGSTVKINQRDYSIIGITPLGFGGLHASIGPDVWLPLGEATQFAGQDLFKRGSAPFQLVGKLQPGIDIEGARSQLSLLDQRLSALPPADQAGPRQLIIARPAVLNLGSVKPDDESFLTLFATLAMGLSITVLLVACLNLANMLLARGTARQKEIAIRLSLGATRWRIIRQLLVEGLFLSLLGGGLGLLLSVWSADLLYQMSSAAFASGVFALNVQPFIDLQLLCLTLFLCLMATLASSLGPALRVTKLNLVGDLKQQQGEPAVTGKWNRFFSLRNSLVMVQIALSLTLLFSGGLFIQGSARAGSHDHGFQQAGQAVANLDYRMTRLPGDKIRLQQENVLAHAAVLPGVSSVALASNVPFNFELPFRPVFPVQENAASPASAKDRRSTYAGFTSVSRGYFSTLAVTFLRGRDFTPAESSQEGGPRVAIIDETLARALFGEEDALGRHFFTDEADLKGDHPERRVEIVGIVRSPQDGVFSSNPPRRVYRPLGQAPQSNVYLHVKTINPEFVPTVLDTLRRELRHIEPDASILALRPLADYLDKNINLLLVRLSATVFGAFGAVALLLAVVGVYGVKAHAVARRTREIGIRLALGARPVDVLALIMKQGVLQTLTGLGAGLLFALIAGQLLSKMLYRVNSADPVVLAASAALLAIAALLACWLPARRATKVDPMVALRAE